MRLIMLNRITEWRPYKVVPVAINPLHIVSLQKQVIRIAGESIRYTDVVLSNGVNICVTETLTEVMDVVAVEEDEKQQSVWEQIRNRLWSSTWMKH